MNLPPVVRIGYLTCAVRSMPAEEAAARGVDGYFDEHTGLIEVAENLAPALKADALLHEMLHAMCLLGHAGLDNDTEERVVRVLTTQLLSAMRDNPAVFMAMIHTVSEPIEY